MTINQAAGQGRPDQWLRPINFTVTFSEAVSGFATGDVSFAGSTVGVLLVGTVTDGPAIYNVAVSGMTSNGAVVASIPASVATDIAGNNNSASTSADNTVAYYTTATIEVRIGENLMGNYTIPSGGKEMPRHGMANGPSAGEEHQWRADLHQPAGSVLGTASTNWMGYPADQLTTEYWFTYYDDIYMSTWLMIGNPDPVRTANVEVYIGASTTPIATYDIQKGQSVLPRFGIADEAECG
ncbi:MAG: Ig-like domain-containing protein [Candidatus Moduliflexus flocculans]|nr:Ig-like domain-containing protein [Candidatus Moduliflexus flocculans]